MSTATGFDLQEVKQRAQVELATLSEKESEILSQLEEVRRNKLEIEQFLGIKKTGGKRNRYRTKVKEYFEGVTTSEPSISVDAQSLLDELFESDASMLGGLKVSLIRLGREANNNYSYDSSTDILTYTTPKE
jgi:hypothetical protein